MKLVKNKLVLVSLNLVLASSIGAILSGCSIKKNLDEMHAATVEVSHTSGEMNKKMDTTNQQMADTKTQIIEQVAISRRLETQTQGLDEKTRQLKLTSEALYRDLRQGNSLTIRGQRLEAMERTPEIDAKVSEAGKYFMAFEFQLYKYFGFDNDANMEKLQLDAIDEFVRDVRRYSFGGYAIDLTSNNDNMKNLFAMSVALHRINPNEEELVRYKNLKELTLLSMILDTLAKKKDIDAGVVQAKEFEHQILVNEDDMVYMLQLRSNFLAGMVLEKLSGVQEAGFLRKAKMALFHWAADFSELNHNQDQLKEYAKWMSECLRIRDLLSKMGYDTRIDGMLVKLYRHMNVQVTAVKPTDKAGVRQHAIAEQELLKAIDKFRN
jgi:hypothetical protein